jgi:hypothetical protein
MSPQSVRREGALTEIDTATFFGAASQNWPLAVAFTPVAPENYDAAIQIADAAIVSTEKTLGGVSFTTRSDHKRVRRQIMPILP